ncbi:hypothetical protein CEXT_727791 [Caerostris extrusa]|uniref:Ubiquitin-like protease family profile domain-containing protein n=1 Tax=Caerostris extrusa TaxID=172846 RepID=A0AAV4Y9J0_CAEEX|nr:hypothetical protein CEXT_727791 [Caerostris extrusa]
MNEQIDGMFSNPAKETVSTVGHERITAFDIQTLAGLNWLNDSVMHYYLSLIAVRSLTEEYRQRKCPTIHTYNTYFYSALRKKGEAHVLRWTRKVEIFKFDILFVPIHFGLHWALCVINNRYKTIKFYDSMRGTDDGTLKALQSYVVLELQTRTGVENPTPYSLEIIKDIPQQMNGSDCGMFALKYAEYISRNAPFTFTQENMPYFRRRMVYEIITNQLF